MRASESPSCALRNCTGRLGRNAGTTHTQVTCIEDWSELDVPSSSGIPSGVNVVEVEPGETFERMSRSSERTSRPLTSDHYLFSVIITPSGQALVLRVLALW